MAAICFTKKLHPCRARIVCKPLSHRRTFHVTSPTRILNESFAITHSFLTGLHTFTGLPWAATLPLAGFIVRSFMIAPLSYYSEIIRLRRRALQPLQYAWLHFFRRKTLEDHAALGPAKCNRLSNKLFSAKKAELNKRHGTQLWKGFVPYFQIPIFLVIIETLRKMCGTEAGVLGLLVKSFSGSGETATPEDSDHVFVPTEQSFAMEGALWFPNLLVPDPISILPFALSGSLLANVFYHMRQAKSSNIWQRMINNILITMAFAIGPLTLQVPSAMLIYWISSSTIALGHSIALNWYIPRPPQILPCKPRENK